MAVGVYNMEGKQNAKRLGREGARIMRSTHALGGCFSGTAPTNSQWRLLPSSSGSVPERAGLPQWSNVTGCSAGQAPCTFFALTRLAQHATCFRSCHHYLSVRLQRLQIEPACRTGLAKHLPIASAFRELLVLPACFICHLYFHHHLQTTPTTNVSILSALVLSKSLIRV